MNAIAPSTSFDNRSFRANRRLSSQSYSLDNFHNLIILTRFQNETLRLKKAEYFEQLQSEPHDKHMELRKLF